MRRRAASPRTAGISRQLVAPEDVYAESACPNRAAPGGVLVPVLALLLGTRGRR